MGNIDSQLDQLAHLYGYRMHKFSEEDANDIIALDFQQKSNMMLKQYSKFPFRQYGESGVHMHLRIVERKQISEQQHGLDAWVAPLFDKDKHAFAIYLSIGLVRGISEVFTAMAVGPEKLISGIVSQDMEEHFQNYIYLRITSALTFILLHETAHILRAHIPFYYQERYARGRKNARLSFHLIESTEGTESFMRSARVHRSMEIDADTLAIGLIHEFLSMRTRLVF